MSYLQNQSNDLLINITSEEWSEIVGWGGGALFIIAQSSQIIHTSVVKNTTDISYGLQILWLIGNCLFTTFGYIENSYSMFITNLITCATTAIQIVQKVYYDNYYKKKTQVSLLNDIQDEEI